MNNNFCKTILFSFVFALSLFINNVSAQCTAVIGANIKQGCEVLTVQFNDLSAGAVQNRTWDFGDGSPTSGAQSPSHSYNAGVIGDTVYVVTLSIQCISSGSSSITDTIKVYKKPKVLFAANKTTVCVWSDSICFTNNSSSGAGYSYMWNFGDGFSSTAFLPCHIYSTPSIYSVQLTVTNPKGCVNSITANNFSVIASPNPDFTLSPILGCTPQNVIIVNTTDTLSSVISSWSWDFGDGTSLFSGSQPGSHTYTAAGTYFIKLTATNSLGCSNRTIKAIVVRTTPAVSFTATSPVCMNDSSLVVFTGTASSIAAYNWNFSGGTGIPGTGEGPHKVNWTIAGIHTVSLSVTDSGCVATFGIPVTVHPNAVISLAVSPNDTVCQNKQLTFTASPGSYVNYKFFVNNIQVQSSQSNVYQTSAVADGDNVKVTAINLWGCSNTSNVITIHVDPVPTVTITSSTPTICIGDAILFTALPAGLSNYTFFDGSLVVQSSTSNLFTYSNPPNGHFISVVATNLNSCISSASNTIGISIIPPMQSPIVNCGTTTPNSVEFVWNSVSGALSYQVSVNGGAYVTPSSGSSGLIHLINGLNPNDTAEIVVMAIGSAPCTDTTYSVLTACVAKPCTAVSFLYSPSYSVCKGEILNLTISGLSASTYGVSWNGGPNTTSTSFSLTAIANATVTVNIVDSTQLNCPPTKGVIVINVDTVPNVTLTSSVLNDSICTGSSIVFTALPSNLTNYAFYNGSVQLQSGVSNTFTTNSLLAGNSISVVGFEVGCSDTSNSINTTIIQPILPPQVVCDVTTSNSIQFIWNSVSGATGYQVSVNGGPFITPSSGILGLTHMVTGLSPGDAAYIIVQALGNGLCGNSVISVPVTCFAMSCTAINYSVNSNVVLCKGDTAVLSISGITISPYSVSWNGEPSTLATTYTISPLADTLITVLVLNPNQPTCVPAIKYFNIHVIDKPMNVSVVSSSANDTICKGTLLTFTASPPGYSNYAFYDGFLLLQYTNSNTYKTSNWVNGHTLTVVADNQGCVGTPSNSITTAVIDPLNVPQVNCGNSTNNSIEFVWNSIAGAIGYEVSVNGGLFITPSSGSTGLLHLVTALNPGDIRTIIVRALGNAPCGNSSTSTIHSCTAIPCTAITYSVSPALYITSCQNDTITLSLTNISTSSPAISWNGGTPGAATSYSFVVSTNTVVTVSVNDLLQPACSPSGNQYIITAIPTPTLSISTTAVNDSLCQGQSITITATPAGYSNYAFYNNSTLLQSSNNPNYTTAILSTGNSLYAVASNNGCASTSNIKKITVSALPSVTLTSSASGDTSCFGDTIIFTANPAGFDSYEFYNGSTLLQNSASNILNLNALPVGNSNTITVIASNDGCKGGVSNAVITEILALPVITITSSDPNGIICSGDIIIISASPANLAGYTFYNGATVLQNSALSTYSTTLLASGNSITAVGANSKGCRSQASNSIVTTINPLPDPMLSTSDTGICLGSSTAIVASLLAPFTTSSLIWSTGSVSSSITVSPTANTSYFVTATYNGCPQTDTLKVYVDTSPFPIADAGTSATFCVGDIIQLNGSGGNSYHWSPVFGLNDTLLSNPNASPTQTTMYILTVTNIYCFDIDSVLLTADKCLEDITGPIPSVITPNGDGSNDFFSVPDIDYFTKNELVFYNRWGNLVFSAKPYNNDWFGISQSGKDLPDGVYYYVLDLGNGSKNKTGYVLINR